MKNLKTITLNSSPTEEDIRYVSRRWRSEMGQKNGTLDHSRSFRRVVGGLSGDPETQKIDDTPPLWSQNIFDGFGYLISDEDYNVLIQQYPEETVGDITTMSNAIRFYENNYGSQYGLYYASNLIFDGDETNDAEGLTILKNESFHHRNNGESSLNYNPSNNADFILGKYYSNRDRNTSLEYYISAANNARTDIDYVRRCFASSVLDLAGNETDDSTFLNNLGNAVHQTNSLREFTQLLDSRLTIKGHDLTINADTWIDIQSELILSDSNDGTSPTSADAVSRRLVEHVTNGNLSSKDALNFIIRTNINNNILERTNGYNKTQSCVLLSSLYNNGHVTIDDVNATFSAIIDFEEAKATLDSYTYLITTQIENNQSFKPEQKEAISDYIFDNYVNNPELKAEDLAPSLLTFYNRGIISRDNLTEARLGTENYTAFQREILNGHTPQSSLDIANSLLYLQNSGSNENKTIANGYLNFNKTSIHDIVSNVLNDRTISLDDRRTLLNNYKNFLENNNENALTDQQQEDLNNAQSLINREILSQARQDGEDILTTIDRLVNDGVMTREEANAARDELLRSGHIAITDSEMQKIEIETEDGEKLIADFTAHGWYDKILGFSFKNNSNGKEIIDVISDYGWMNNTTNKNITSSGFIKQNNIPYCYAIEYRQLYNASISNILLSMISIGYSARGVTSGVVNLAGSVIDSIIDMSKGIFGSEGSQNVSTTIPSQDGGQSGEERSTSNGNPSFWDTITNWGSRFVRESDDKFRNLFEFIAKLDKDGPIGSSHKSGLLNPYRMMYMLKKTEKQFCFPMLDKNASSYKVKNKMDENDGGQGTSLLGNRFFGMIANVARTALGFAQDINHIAPFFQDVIQQDEDIKGMRQYQIERSKFFSYPTDGEEIEVNFVLFNTVKRDVWKKHFNFIFGFILRNLPFKHDLVSFYPPLFYDVIVPGVKRCPYCYVESVDVTPFGLMRNMSVSSKEIGLPDLTDGNDIDYSVNVPEAWQIKITFKSLIATSGNQILSGFVDMPIQASSSNSSPSLNTNN